MLVFVFFAAVFSSLSWLIYGVMFVNSRLAAERLWEQSPENMLIYLAVVCLPVLVIWMVFGLLNQFVFNREMNLKQNELLKQLQKNQDYTDLVVRVMLDAEHEIKDGFVINKFDTFIADMNESLSEIIQRCNIASSAQLEQLWQRVKRGEKWALGKAVIDASKNQRTFEAWVREKVGRDKVFRGTLLEFCSRYQNLVQLLEKHDRDRIFLQIIETGVFGKVYSVIAPLSEGISEVRVAEADRISASPASAKDYASALKMATMQEPEAGNNIVNVDNGDDYEAEPEIAHQSFFSRLNPFRRKYEEDTGTGHEQDPFFQALHNSFQSDGEASAVPESEPSVSPVAAEPKFEVTPEKNEPVFGSLRNTLDSLRSTNGTLENSAFPEPQFTAVPEMPEKTAENFSALSKNEKDKTSGSSEKTAESSEDMAYPFGGWTNEENYR